MSQDERANSVGGVVVSTLLVGTAIGALAGALLYWFLDEDMTEGWVVGALVSILPSVGAAGGRIHAGALGFPRRLRINSGDHLGEWRVVRELWGRGGGGAAVPFEVTSGPRRGLMKVALRSALSELEVSRFKREVESAKLVDSEFVAKVIDDDVAGPFIYVVYEYRGDNDLSGAAAQLDVESPQGAPLAFNIAYGLAVALEALHERRVTHRDVKPTNTIVLDRSPVLVDFGQSWFVGATTMTATQGRLGTPAYRSPEMVTGLAGRSPSSDIFQWASTVYFACTGQPPFGADEETVDSQILSGDVDLSLVPAWLKQVLSEAFALEPMSRPTASELEAHLRTVATGAGWALPVPPAVPPSRLLSRPPPWLRWSAALAIAFFAVVTVSVTNESGGSGGSAGGSGEIPALPSPTQITLPTATSTPRPASTATPRPASTATPRPASTATPPPIVDISTAGWPTSGNDGSQALHIQLGADLSIPDWVRCETVTESRYCLVGLGANVAIYTQNPVQKIVELPKSNRPDPYAYLSEAGFSEESVRQLLGL